MNVSNMAPRAWYSLIAVMALSVSGLAPAVLPQGSATAAASQHQAGAPAGTAEDSRGPFSRKLVADLRRRGLRSARAIRGYTPSETARTTPTHC